MNSLDYDTYEYQALVRGLSQITITLYKIKFIIGYYSKFVAIP